MIKKSTFLDRFIDRVEVELSRNFRKVYMQVELGRIREVMIETLEIKSINKVVHKNSEANYNSIPKNNIVQGN